MTTVAERPFCFDLDDIEITGCVMPPEPPPDERTGSGGSYKPELHAPMRAGDRVPGVWITHKPTGRQMISTQMPTRDENIAVALRRLDRSLRRAKSR
jgi:hypothetical protein